MGTKRSMLTDEKGLPLSVVLSGADTHDIKLLKKTLIHFACAIFVWRKLIQVHR